MVENKEEMVSFDGMESSHKNIMIFNITGMNTEFTPQTHHLINKMNQVAKENNMDVTIGMDSASKIESKGKEADIILLSPELFAMEAEIKAKLPDKVIKVIDQKDYGFMNAAGILKLALS